jgi:ATP phosphoribosyltransferase regulatory subunit
MGFSLAKLQESLACAGFQQHTVPLIEPAALFQTKGGERVIERMLAFRHGNADFALRPEFTASAAQHFALSGEDSARWQFHGPVFAIPDNGGRRFHGEQLGAEILGRGGALADAELISAALTGLHDSGVTNCVMELGHAGLTRLLLQEFGLEESLNQFLMTQRLILNDADPDALETALSAVEHYLGGWSASANHPNSDREVISAVLSIPARGTALGGRTREAIAERLALKRRRAAHYDVVSEALSFLQAWFNLRGKPDEIFETAITFCHSETTRVVVDEWHEMLDLLKIYGLPTENITLVPGLDRVWDYYTGIVFNLRTADGVAIGGGGRYDGLVRLIAGGTDRPAVGFGLDLDRLVSHYGQADPQEFRSVQIQPMSSAAVPTAIRLASAIREQGIPCIIDGKIMPKSSAPTVSVTVDHAQFLNVDYIVNVESTLLIETLTGALAS